MVGSRYFLVSGTSHRLKSKGAPPHVARGVPLLATLLGARTLLGGRILLFLRSKTETSFVRWFFRGGVPEFPRCPTRNTKNTTWRRGRFSEPGSPRFRHRRHQHCPKHRGCRATKKTQRMPIGGCVGGLSGCPGSLRLLTAALPNSRHPDESDRPVGKGAEERGAWEPGPGVVEVWVVDGWPQASRWGEKWKTQASCFSMGVLIQECSFELNSYWVVRFGFKLGNLSSAEKRRTPLRG